MHLSAENLAAKRGEDLIFVKISFHLAPGGALVLTGRNGSGKSTLLRVLAGFWSADSGSVTFVDGKGRSDRAAGEASHYLGHRNAMKNELTVAENLTFWKEFLGDDDAGVGLSIDAAADAVGLSAITHLPFGYLSAGQQRRMALAKLLVAYRPIWILDEPTAALDTAAAELVAELIKAHQERGGIALVATHQTLGLANTRGMEMTGFAGVGEGVWG